MAIAIVTRCVPSMYDLASSNEMQQFTSPSFPVSTYRNEKSSKPISESKL
jgi:hypothetical protein